jgi:hypothetical protein
VLPQVRDIRPKFPQDYRDPFSRAGDDLAAWLVFELFPV